MKKGEDESTDTNIMDQLLFDGFWLETTDGSNFMPADDDLNSTSFYFPNNSNIDPPQESDKSPALSCPEMGEQFLVEETEMNITRLWVEPKRDAATHTISVKKRLVQAVNYLKDSVRDKDVLIQIWVPVKRGGRRILTTKNQPFSLNPNCKNLAEYRDVSRNYQFPADEDSKEFIGLPGRVFLKKFPEYTPDVRFFKREEYPRVNHAHHYDVRGSFGLPVFEHGSGNCLGVVEIVTTIQKVNYRLELEDICKALEAVDLKSSNLLSPPSLEDCNVSYQAALTEIKTVLKYVCDAHKLPLAQTWAPCIQQGKGECRHSDESYSSCCTSTIDSACYVADPQVSGFHEACCQHHLLKGEGIAGKAFLTNQPCFAGDIKAFSKTDYPLAHHARVFNLCASLAIRLRSTYTGITVTDFVLEFFFPLNCKDTQDQMPMLDSLSSLVQQSCQSLRVVTDQELAREIGSTSAEPSSDTSSWIMCMKGKGVSVSLDNHEVKSGQGNNSASILDYDQGPKGSAVSFSSGHLSFRAKTSNEKMQTKAEKLISLQVLRQHFSGSLKDAAKSIGVCPTTLKRICRQHGISRWPSRKIKKVSHSLRKLQLVIDSVQGAEGSIKLSSFYNSFPQLESSNEPGRPPTTSKQLNIQPEGNLLSSQTTVSKSTSSSGCHSSSSSYCCSTGVKHSSFPANGADTLSAEMNGGILKRAQSDAELHDKSQEERKLLAWPYSHKIFSDHAPIDVPKNSNQVQHDVCTFRVKATFGEEKIRFSLQSHWGFDDLQQEVLRRFNIENGGKVDLKYLDDDAEWVLLTCDDDLEECIYIHRSSRTQTIKLSLNQAYYPSLRNPFGKNGPS